MASSYSEIPFLAQFSGAAAQQQQRPQPQQQRQQLDDQSKTPTVEGIKKQDDSNKDNEEIDHDNERKNISDSDNEDEDISPTGEINKKHKRPISLQYDSSFPYELERTSSNDGEMRHFNADNPDEQRRAMSPNSKRDQTTYGSHNSTPSTSTTGSLLTRHFLQTQLPQIDANVLSDIELEAQYLAASVDNLMENLCNLLHSISSITADNVEVHRNAVNKLTDGMDANIKCMYTIMAKTEEVTKSMKPTEQLGQRIREIKRLVDMLDSTM